MTGTTVPRLLPPSLARLRRQAAQLAALQAAGTLAEDDFRAARAQLERRVVDAVLAAPSAGGGTARRWAAGALAVLALAGAGTAWWSQHPADPVEPAAQQPAAGGHAVTSDQIEAMVGRLEARLRERPDDAEGWAMLARSHAVQGRHARAVPAFRQALALRPDDALLLADAADAIAVANGRRLAGEPEELVRRALAIDPTQLKALSLAGTAAFDRGDFAGALRHWEPMLRNAPQDALTRQIEGGIAAARERLAAAPPRAP